MKNNQQHLEALQEIRQMMRESNKFLSLSGLSGIFAGIYALIGSYLGITIIQDFIDSGNYSQEAYNRMIWLCILVCAAVLVSALLTAMLFSSRKARRHGQKFFDHTAWRLMINMLIPLAGGGLFCIALLFHGRSTVLFICPSMLIFYGLALVNGSKYTLPDIRYLGCLEILLGLIAAFNLGYGIIFWAIGFGVLHIVYGAYMWFKYDRKY